MDDGREESATAGRTGGAEFDDLVAARDHMEQLVRAIVAIGSHLDLDVTLHRILDAARELSGAPYAALGIRAADGAFGSFVLAGLDEETARQLGDIPLGAGVRLDDVAVPPLRALLALPIIVRANDFGVLYLADDRPGRTFSDAAENSVRALATAAAAAIDNARLFERERESAKWTRASREITTALLSGDPQTGPLQLIVNLALDLADAEQAILLVPREAESSAEEVDTLVVAATAGRYSSEVIGREVPMGGSTTGGVARRGRPLITDSFQYPIEGFTDVGERSAIVMPLIADDAVIGVIAVARHPHQPAFGDDYLELVSDFARHAALALTLTAGREHVLNRELAQADTVDDALAAAVEELRRLWRARRVLAVTFPIRPGDLETVPRVASAGEATDWLDLPLELREALSALRDGDLLTPHALHSGTAGIAIQHPAGVMVVWIELTDHRSFTLEDQTLLTVLAGRLSAGLQRVHQVDQQRETALALQHAILGPADLPHGFTVRYQAASAPLEVGGDWYDVVDLDDGRIAMIVGDCVGHGLAAATVMGQVRSACRALLFDNPSPGAALRGMDRFAARLPARSALPRSSPSLTRSPVNWSTPAPGIRRRSWVTADGCASLLDDAHTIALGLRADWPRPEGRITMPSGATVVLYTDGLVERRRIPLERGIARVAELIQEHRATPLEELANGLMSGLAPDGGYQDDVVLLLYRHPAPLELTFLPDAGELAPTRAALRRWLKMARMSPERTMEVLVAAGEAVANAIEHGHRHNPGGTVSVLATALVDHVQLTITDCGSWKPPGQPPDLRRGRGIGIMRSLMNDVTISHGSTGTTVNLYARIA